MTKRNLAFFAGVFMSMSAVCANANTWRFSHTVDAMDDTSQLLALSSPVPSGTPADHDPQASLRVVCDREDGNSDYDGVITVSLRSTYVNIDGETSNVLPNAITAQGRIRFGSDAPGEIEVSTRRGDKTVTIRLSGHSRNAGGHEVVRRLLEVDKVLVEIPQYGPDPQFAFVIGDDAKHTIRKVYAMCEVSLETGLPDGPATSALPSPNLRGHPTAGPIHSLTAIAIMGWPECDRSVGT